MTVWKDISSAPKDRWILAWDQDGGHALIRYNDIFAMAGEDTDGWMGATHWTELPPPPDNTDV
jgi:hypothetical protein